MSNAREDVHNHWMFSFQTKLLTPWKLKPFHSTLWLHQKQWLKIFHIIKVKLSRMPVVEVNQEEDKPAIRHIQNFLTIYQVLFPNHISDRESMLSSREIKEIKDGWYAKFCRLTTLFGCRKEQQISIYRVKFYWNCVVFYRRLSLHQIGPISSFVRS